MNAVSPPRPAPFIRRRPTVRELPADLLEDADALSPWVEKSVDVARRSRKSKGKKK